MDAIYFLKKRTDFIRFYYDTSAKPFAETRRCIEEKLPPYTPQSPPKMLGDTRRAGGDSSTPPQSPNSGFARTNEISPSRPVFDRPAGGMEYRLRWSELQSGLATQRTTCQQRLTGVTLQLSGSSKLACQIIVATIDR